MTTGEKAAATRAAHTEKQKQKQKEREHIRQAIVAACLEAIDCEQITPAEKLQAAVLLDAVRKELY